jgi:hypothetical protein
MKLTTIRNGETLSVKDLETGEVKPLAQVFEVQSEEDVGQQTEPPFNV